ncbi:MAG: thioredoxin domain-containing protein [Candidatus Paceibacterota bacterium]|jgi:protein-disulfide isomerase
MDEHIEEKKIKKDYLLPASIVLAAVLVSVSLIYNVGKRGEVNTPQAANIAESADATPSFKDVKAITADDHIVGSIDAPVRIIEYSDFECPFCKRFHATMQQTVEAYTTNVAWIYRQLPLDQLHPRAIKEAEASECAAELGGNTKFWEYAKRLLELTPSNNGLDPTLLPTIATDVGLNKGKFEECLKSERNAPKVKAQVEEGTAILKGRPGTPLSIFVVSKGISKDARTFIEGANAYFLKLDPTSPPPFFISEDGTMVSMGGALPYTWIQKMMDAFIAK